jgi:hypothetical protein
MLAQPRLVSADQRRIDHCAVARHEHCVLDDQVAPEHHRSAEAGDDGDQVVVGMAATGWLTARHAMECTSPALTAPQPKLTAPA